ncbi:hypothetical protein FPHYL_7554 [Fusarium phyllophilum]|uniref:Uncharacterized protein n=1 Tax=Fusarium phyllophilum TaxID=47803 RepID=A0A8H5JMI4_9HYPO|nr:hypothetical protein FPHYL_7554 [Fusarium phyllophilum]
MAENAELRRDLHRAQRTSLQLLDAQEESAERIRELQQIQQSKCGLEQEVADLRSKLSFATDTIITEMRDKLNDATVASSTINALKEQIADQTDTIQQLETQKKSSDISIGRLEAEKTYMNLEINRLRQQIEENRRSRRGRKRNSGRTPPPKPSGFPLSDHCPWPGPISCTIGLRTWAVFG